ncbi:MAG: hypothetical protein HN352_12110 [Bacteroidetes bacterium]|jgi:uncharacterized Zn finger protein|nr:hypothetical protein [Bacteroidota bacterium]MBT3749453.1 hypothetical protein [Bacteroidota bacterium]MBT4401968.1 hypothetical protein [Bacteroidota bacterium]MBT4410436.1 hypothetical protein [Bacteroidota bacterium]MBT7092263.1 hypothetical protein [Bacteroidota bacterium]
MNLSNFRSKISPVILERGKVYYHNNSVTDLKMMENGLCFASVDGSGEYDVDITISENGEIADYLCNCQDENYLCHHIVAVLFSIEEVLSSCRNEKVWF